MTIGLIRRVIWAVDAFEESPLLHENVIQTLKTLSKKCSELDALQIEPTYVLSPDQLNLPQDYATNFMDRYQPAAKQALNQKIKDTNLKGLLEPKVLIHRHYSFRSFVQRFLNYAEESHADLIVVGSHGRTGISKFLLGSFTETLLGMSTIPVLVIGPSSNGHSNLSHVLFPTELHEQPSQSALPKAISIAKQLKAKLTIHHCIPRLLEPAFRSGVYLLGGGWVPPLQFMQRQEEKQQNAARPWIQFGKDANVDTDVCIDADSGGIVDSILAQARNSGSDLIVIEAQRGPVTSALLGSITRQVVRLASCPVWVLRSNVDQQS